VAEKKNWVQGARLHKGAFTAKAKAAGKSVQAYAKSVIANPEKHSGTTRKQASLARTFSKMAHK
jgi:hypothetical protein